MFSWRHVIFCKNACLFYFFIYCHHGHWCICHNAYRSLKDLLKNTYYFATTLNSSLVPKCYPLILLWQKELEVSGSHVTRICRVGGKGVPNRWGQRYEDQTLLRAFYEFQLRRYIHTSQQFLFYSFITILKVVWFPYLSVTVSATHP